MKEMILPGLKYVKFKSGRVRLEVIDIFNKKNKLVAYVYGDTMDQARDRQKKVLEALETWKKSLTPPPDLV